MWDRYRDIPGINDACVSDGTVLVFAQREAGVVQQSLFLAYMRVKEGAFLVWPDYERLFLVNSFFPDGITLQQILKRR